MGTDEHRLSDGGDGNFVLFGEFLALVAFEEQRFAGFEGEDGNSGGGAGLEGFRADARDVEAHVVVLLGYFHGHRAAVFAGEFAAAREAFVRAFKSFHGEHGAVFNHGQLADFQPGNFLGNAETKRDVLALFGRELRPERKACLRHERREPGRSVDEFHAVFLQFIGHGAEQSVRVFFLHPHEHTHCAEIGTQVEKIFRRELAGHDALLDAAAGEGGNHLADLADIEPDDLIHQRGECGVGLALGGDGDDALDAGGAGQPREIERQRAAAGDEADGFKRKVHAIWDAQFSRSAEGIQPGIICQWIYVRRGIGVDSVFLNRLSLKQAPSSKHSAFAFSSGATASKRSGDGQAPEKS
jgi:hypothetical protein